MGEVDQVVVEGETPEEARRRRKREANARWMAVPENRQKYNERLAAARATEEGSKRKRENQARWLAKRREALAERPAGALGEVL